MKLACNKLGDEDQHMFYQVITKNIYFLFVRTYLRVKGHQAPTHYRHMYNIFAINFFW
jgi:hypothetical protein